MPLEYRLGSTEIDKGRITEPIHYLIVVHANGAILAYMAPISSHRLIAEHFGIRENIVGGAIVIRDDVHSLGIIHRSVAYQGIPATAAQEIGRLVSAELERQGMDISGLHVRTLPPYNPFWLKQGITA